MLAMFDELGEPNDLDTIRTLRQLESKVEP